MSNDFFVQLLAPVQALQAARSAAKLADARFPALQPGQAMVLRKGSCGPT
jgi:hypothetical protein